MISLMVASTPLSIPLGNLLINVTEQFTESSNGIYARLQKL